MISKLIKITFILASLYICSTSIAVLPTVSDGYYIEAYVSGFQNVNAIAFSPGGAFGYAGQLFAADSRPDPGTFYRVPHKGEKIFFTTSSDSTPRSIEFAPIDSLFVPGIYATQAYSLWRYNSDGTKNQVSSIGAFGWDLVFAPYDSFGKKLYHVDSDTIYRWSPTGIKEVFKGSLPQELSGFAFGPGGEFGTDLYLAFSTNSSIPAIRKIGPDGTMTDFVVSPLFKQTNQLAFDTTGNFRGNLFVSDWENNVIFEIEPNGNVSTFASGFSFYNTPYHKNDGGDIVFGPDGAMYIADGGAGTVWRIAPMPETLNYIEIKGPQEIFEGDKVQYKVFGNFDSNTVIDITSSCNFSLSDNSAGTINQQGEFFSNPIDKDKAVTISCEYEWKGQIFHTGMTVHIFAICPYGYALSFDGSNDWIRVPRSTSLEPSEITVELWAYLVNRQLSETRIVRKAGHFGNGYILAASQSGQVIQLRVDNSGTVIAADTKDNSVYIGKWHHFAGVYTISSASLYIDGIKVCTVSHNKGPMKHNPLTDLTIGNGLFSSQEAFAGLVDEVRIWNYPRSQEEIQSTMHISLAGNEQGLVGYWNFDEGEGQIVNDLSGHENNGFLGTDPNNPDSADPVWIESDAPVGICSNYLIAKQLIEKAIKGKRVNIEQIQKQIEMEEDAIEALRDMLANKEFDIIDKQRITASINDIHSAIQAQQLSLLQLNKGLALLINSLLQIAPENADLQTDVLMTGTDGISVEGTRPSADINGDSKVNFEDFVILTNQWMAGT